MPGTPRSSCIPGPSRASIGAGAACFTVSPPTDIEQGRGTHTRIAIAVIVRGVVVVRAWVGIVALFVVVVAVPALLQPEAQRNRTDDDGDLRPETHSGLLLLLAAFVSRRPRAEPSSVLAAVR